MKLSEKLAASNGRPAGFDYMRLGLATAIVGVHSIAMTLGSRYNDEVWLSHWRIVMGALVPAFFVLSGFLVGGSLIRCRTVVGFLYLRAIRIFPALIVESLVAALILGPIFTNIHLSLYFSSVEFFRYFFNCFGDVQYVLPGVFTQNPYPKIINGQLWTVPFELDCYITLGVLALAGVVASKRALLLLLITMQISCVALFIKNFGEQDLVIGGHLLIFYFLSGLGFFIFSNIIPFSAILCVLSGGVSIIMLDVAHGYYLAVLPISYTTVYLGLLNPRRLHILQSGDYSYGIFLYGFPVQQAVVASGLFTLNPWTNFAISFPCIALVSYLSWHMCEKYLLRLRKYRNWLDQKFAFTSPGWPIKVILMRWVNPDKVWESSKRL
jgi:peptidoglycan/LPS O-acetylase OafA/YrhL